jgi:hypothetical protein
MYSWAISQPCLVAELPELAVLVAHFLAFALFGVVIGSHDTPPATAYARECAAASIPAGTLALKVRNASSVRSQDFQTTFPGEVYGAPPRIRHLCQNESR